MIPEAAAVAPPTKLTCVIGVIPAPPLVHEGAQDPFYDLIIRHEFFSGHFAEPPGCQLQSLHVVFDLFREYLSLVLPPQVWRKGTIIH